MKTTTPFPVRAALLPIALLSCLHTAASAGERAAFTDPEPPAAVLAPDAAGFGRVHYDEPGDGRVWALGDRYKASFGPDGATYYPALGRSAPRNVPHALSPESVTVGGVPLALRRDVAAARAGDRVELDRGTLVEAYELEPHQMEQLFVFASLPNAGAIEVRIPVGGGIGGVETDAGLELRGELSRVAYSRAVAIDAAGRRTSAPTSIADGVITIRVDAEFVATAALPLTIDPTVLNLWVDSNSEITTSRPDVAWDAFNLVWLVVHERVFSATDMDIFARGYNAAGAPIVSGFVDISTASLTRPRVAWNGELHNFLVVTERTSSSPNAVIARTVQPNGTILTMGSQIDIGGAGTDRAPDVGGDPNPADGFFCVVYHHDVGSHGEGEIAYRLIDADGTPIGAGPGFLPHIAGVSDAVPSISRSNDSTQWLVAWKRDDMSGLGDIYGARIAANGTVLDAPFPISTGFSTNDSFPSASSPLHGTTQCLVALQRNSTGSTNYAVRVALVDGATVVTSADITTLESSGMAAVAQVDPSVDSDGRHFLLAYAEFDANFHNYDVFASDLCVSGGQLALSQSHVNVNHMGLTQRYPQVAAQRNSTGGGQRHFLAYDVTGTDVAGSLFDGFTGGPVVTSCAGDGSVTDCPCGNNGAAGRGCGNTVSPAGALLSTTGVASTLADTLQLHAFEMPNSTCLYFQGTVANAPAVFGDGLRCVGGTVTRLASRTVSGNASVFPIGPDAPLATAGSVPVGGATRIYQVWYRNAGAFCTSATFNLTNGVTVSWSR